MSRRVLVLTQQYWGRGKNFKDAIDTLRDTGFSSQKLSQDNLIGVAEITWDSSELDDDISDDDVVEKFFVNDMGGVVRPTYEAVEYKSIDLDNVTIPSDVNNVADSLKV